MQKNTSLGESMNTTSKKIKIECSETPTVNIPSKIFSDVYYLHSKYQGKEWSGHLYYTKQGDINNPSELIIDVKEFVLLDLGTAGSTEIDPTGEQIIDMYEKRPQILTMQSGLVHTHHNMRTFFSGTDWDTLLENASNYDFFLSVIFNNAGDTIAKISLQGFIEEPEASVKYSYKFNRGFVEKIETREKKVTEVVYVYTCKVNIENNVDEELTNLLKAKENKSIAYKSFDSQLLLSERSFIDDWAEERKLNPRDPNFKVKPHKQTELFEKPTIKELTISFLTCLILQDDDLDFTFNTTYQQALDSWKEEVGDEMVEQFTEYVDHIVGDVFDNIFGEEITEEDLRDIKINVNIILSDSTPEKAIKPIVSEYLNSLK